MSRRSPRGRGAGAPPPRRGVVIAPPVPEARAEIIAFCTRAGARLVLVDEVMRIEPERFTLYEQTFSLHGPWGSYEHLRLSLVGAHQLTNAATAVAAVEGLSERGFPAGKDGIKGGVGA